ncbi:hypothetical protein AAFH68_34950 [Flavobacterium sp. CGRL1]
MSAIIVQELLEKTKDFSLDETLVFLAEEFPGKVIFSTSFGQED